MPGRHALRLLKRWGFTAGLLAAALPALAANGGKPDFGPNVLIFDPSMPAQAIQKQIDAVYAMQEHNEFGPQRNALLFLPGSYSVDVPVGFYTEVLGLGASPDATQIAGNVHADASTAQQCDNYFLARCGRISVGRRAARCSGRFRRRYRSGECTCAATWCCISITGGRAAAGCRIRWWTAMWTPDPAAMDLAQQ